MGVQNSFTFQKWKSCVNKLHLDTIQGLSGRGDIEHVQNYGLVCTQHDTPGDHGHQGISNLAWIFNPQISVPRSITRHHLKKNPYNPTQNTLVSINLQDINTYRWRSSVTHKMTIKIVHAKQSETGSPKVNYTETPWIEPYNPYLKLILVSIDVQTSTHEMRIKRDS